MTEADASLIRPILLRPAGEIATKSKRTRHRFFGALRHNVSDALVRHGIAHQIRTETGRLAVHTRAVEQACGVLPRVFGLASISPVEVVCDAALDSILAAGRDAFAARVRGRTYAVRASRQGTHPFSSLDIERQLGSALNAGATVRLDQPDVIVHVEVLGQLAHLYARRIAGAGGLPAGVQGRALVLLSGGFDSAVAAWRLMRRGAAVDFLLCNLGGRAYERMVLRVARVLAQGWGFGVRCRLFVVDFAPMVDALRRNVRAQYWQVVLKRMMYRAAEQVALNTGAQALVTGEALGQVSSQTLANLAAIEACVRLPMLRPLIGWDKIEIIAEARRIGTAPLSERIREYCALMPGHTVTATSPDKVDRAERRLDLGPLWSAVAARREVDLSNPAEDTRDAYLLTRDIPDDAVVIDCQPDHLYSAWHAPGAEHHDPTLLVENPRRLDRDRTYVLYCSEGTQAAYLAELLQRAGYDAYAFDGGASALRRQIEAQTLA